MIPIIPMPKTDWQRLLPHRSQFEYEQVNQTVQEILRQVQARGDEALREYNQKLDRADTPVLEVDKEAMRAAYEALDPQLQAVLGEAKERIYRYHEKQSRHDFITHEQEGTVLGQMIKPIEKVGIYVPGGTAAYPSTVLMNAIPAKIAGVKEIVLVSPPGPNGEIAQAVLAASYVAGVDQAFRVGGAQAIAALSYGTESVPKVYKIVGPGNIYVAMAKKMVFGQIDIDMIAGPSEILIVADETARPDFVAADLLSQAEHDTLACAMLITTSKTLAEETQKELEKQLASLPRKDIAKASLKAYGRIFMAESIQQAIDIANEIAPEHLELAVQDPFAFLHRIQNAGSVFLGSYAPEPLGDYFAGPNHTLPTSGTAKFSSPLSVDDFVKKIQITYYTREAFHEVSDKIATFARAEGLEAHARAAKIREESRE